MLKLRYAHSRFSARFQLMRLLGWLQGKQIFAFNSDSEICTAVLVSSQTKGNFIEEMIACPAWRPAYSIESVDGEDWVYLAKTFKNIYARLNWETKLTPITKKHIHNFAKRPILDAEQISRLTLNIFFELVFERSMTAEEEDLFYLASLEWRKEIAIKGPGDKLVKNNFWAVLEKLIEQSRFAHDLEKNSQQRDLFLSVFAQPLFISPAINFSDIMASVFKRLKADSTLLAQAKKAESEFLKNICLEAIRLEHPFPVLEREMTSDLTVGKYDFKIGNQVFIMLDEFEQETNFDPDRWIKGAKNPYRFMPFGAGPRICLGKNLAQKLLGELLGNMLTNFPLERIQPSSNHQFSGRDNDNNDTLRTSFYQFSIFAKIAKLLVSQIGRSSK